MKKPPARTRTVTGLGVAPGVGIGRAVCVAGRAAEVFRLPIAAARVDAEIDRLRAAVERAQKELDTTRKRAGEELGKELAEIFEAHTLMLDDQAFLGRIEQCIREEQVNAEWAVHTTTEELERRFEALDSPHHKARIEDLLDVAQYLLRFLAGHERPKFGGFEDDVVVVAGDLTPSEAVRLGRERVVGFAIEGGGPTSHTTIIARSLHLPLVAGLHNVMDLVGSEERIIVDGGEGQVILDPSPELVEQYERRRLDQAQEERLKTRSRKQRAVTRDGVEISLLANIDLPEEIHEAVAFGASGIGLYRSEFLYIEKSPELPSEQEHVELYSRLLEEISPHPVTIRTFDLGGRKLAQEVLDTREANPVLGLRGIRLTLARRDIFKIQIRALLRAGSAGQLKIMIPMVSAVEEVLQFKALVEEARAELVSEGLEACCDFELGVMIEVPSAALIADALAREVDFFSIGTNDLIQYAMAVDRNNEHVSYLYRPLHPAILRLISQTVGSAVRAGIDVSICGEMAADPRHAPLLIGLGLRSLSAGPRAIPELKKRILELSAEECGQLAERCLGLASASEVEAQLDRAPVSEGVAS